MQKFNPFRPGKAVAPGMFSGRLNEIQAMERGLFQTKNNNPAHFLIEGERGIGKTSLLLYMDWVAKGEIEFTDNQKFNFVVANVELREGMGSDDVINAILVALKSEIAQKERLKEMCKTAWGFLSKFEIAGVSYSNRDEISPAKFDELTNILINILDGSKDTIDGIVILIDEADRPSSDAKLGEICKLLTERLTRKGHERVCLVLAGLPTLTTKIRESHESALRVFNILPLDPLEPEERKQVINLGLGVAEKANGFSTAINDGAIEMLSDLSEGYPHFLQEFSYFAFEHDNDNRITTEDVVAGAFSENGAMDQLGQKYYMDMYVDQINSEDYRKILMCMSGHMDGWVERQHLMDKSGVKSSNIDNALRTLKERRIIVANPAKSGQYKLPTKSFAIWLKVKASEATASRAKQQITTTRKSNK